VKNRKINLSQDDIALMMVDRVKKHSDTWISGFVSDDADDFKRVEGGVAVCAAQPDLTLEVQCIVFDESVVKFNITAKCVLGEEYASAEWHPEIGWRHDTRHFEDYFVQALKSLNWSSLRDSE
jgi:hypothetical protein